jgi:hypothetical protein
MSRPNTPPRTSLDAEGNTRVKLKRGRTAPSYGQGSHAHYVGTDGVRLDRQGRRVDLRANGNFAAITWDLEKDDVAPTFELPKLAPAIELLVKRSTTVKRLLDEVSRAGWIVQLADKFYPSAVRKGPHVIEVDVSLRHAFVARLVHDIAFARALRSPLPVLDAKTPGFAHDDGLFYLRCEGEAALVTAIVRDEILSFGGPDIGAPGLRGSQLDAYAAFKRGQIDEARAKELIAVSPDGAWVAGADPKRGPRVAQNLDAAFVTERPPPIQRLRSDAIEAIERLRRLRSFDRGALERDLGVRFAMRDDQGPNVHLRRHEADLEYGPLEHAELREPVPGISGLAPRLVLRPRALSYPQVAAWLGPGEPHHVDASLERLAHATVAYPFDTTTMFVTFRVRDVAVRSLTVVPSPAAST